LPGQVYIGSSGYPSGGYPTAPADHITITNFIICYKCPEPGGAFTLGFTADTNVLISNNQIGPACCGTTCDPTCSTATAPNASPTLIGGGGGGEGDAQNITFTGNTLLGVTDNASGTVWPAALGPPPQHACSNNNYCHDDCAHFNSGLINLVVINNVMYNCYAQGIFIEDDEGDHILNGVTIVNNYVGGGNAGIGALLNAAPDAGAQGAWIFAFNTSELGVGMSRVGTGPGFSLTVIGNYGIYGFHDDGGNSVGCAWVPANGTFTIDYNAWYTSNSGNSAPCGSHDVSTSQTNLNVVDPRAWPSNDLNTNFDLNGTGTIANRVVPASVCSTYVMTDIHGKPRPTAYACDAGADQTG
jgi:hypothetical protein